jgi:hypothetical protein
MQISKIASIQILVRALTAVPLLALAYLVGANALVNATRTAIPATALASDPEDAIALAQQADLRWAEAATAGKVIDVSQEAARSLVAQAVNPRALRLLGFGADTRGDKKAALQLNQIAARVSRRESGAQLWLMENAVEQDDVPSVLARYDVLLRTNPKLRDQLYAKLALALSDPEIRNAFVPYIRRAPSWLPGLIAVSSGMPNPDPLAYAIRQAGGLPKTAAYQASATGLLRALFAQRRYAEGRAFFHAMPGSVTQLMTSAAFTESSFDPKYSPMSWTLESSPNTGAKLETSGGTRSLLAFALSGSSGLGASKYLFIPPGTYRFGTAQTITIPGTNCRASWMLRCMSTTDQAVFYQYDIIRSSRAAVPSTQVTIPTRCQVQRLELHLAGGDDSAGLELSVARVEIGR